MGCLAQGRRYTEDVAVEVDLPHFFLDRNRILCFCSTVLIALKDTVLPDLVLNLMRVGFATVFVAPNLTTLDAMKEFYHVCVISLRR